jgi:serine/threonine protein kinase
MIDGMADKTEDEEYTHTVYATKDEWPYKHLEILGRGNFALVDKVEKVHSDFGIYPRIYARKTIRMGHFRPAEQKERVMSEINIVCRCRHRHIVWLIKTYQAGSSYGLIMSPVAEVDLVEYLAVWDRSSA